MKKLLFFFALLASIAANAAVTVTPLNVNYGTKTVTFRVAWTGTPYNNRVWVWVDLCPVTGTSPGTFAKAEISAAAAAAGSILTVSGNTRGFYVTTNPSTVTATLSNATGQFNWCAYGSDYPPTVTASGDTYTLYGTPPFTLIAAGGTTTQTVAATAIAISAVTITPVTLTDQTGCPGAFCIYTGNDLYIDDTHFCQQRAEGAKNWEAWIQDIRDNELYRIVLMPDNKWWLAQNVRYAKTGSSITISGCTPEICGRYYSITEFNSSHEGSSSGTGWGIQGVCPVGWMLPVNSDWTSFLDAISTSASVVGERIRALNSHCTTRLNYYGWADQLKIDFDNTTYHEFKLSNENTANSVYWDRNGSNGSDSCNSHGFLTVTGSRVTPVRCFRDL